MDKFLNLLNIDLDKPTGYIKVFIAACICGLIFAFVKDIFMI